jgi:hypothetical protein
VFLDALERDGEIIRLAPEIVYRRARFVFLVSLASSRPRAASEVRSSCACAREKCSLDSKPLGHAFGIEALAPRRIGSSAPAAISALYPRQEISWAATAAPSR